MRFVDQAESADYLIVNTCGFIQAAKEESLNEILGLAAIKSSNGGSKRLLVTGCLAQRYSDQLLEEIPEIDGMIGIDQLDRITEILDRDAAIISPPHSSYRELAVPTVTSSRPYAYLKIADGCDSGCSYCAIPSIRGRYRSRSLEAIDRDINRYLRAGALELNLIAQDVARYGFDIGKSPLDLLELIERRPENFWLRPFYLHPRNLSDEILNFLRDSEKFCRYLEIPIQHVSSRILKAMNRGYDEMFLRRMFERVHSALPDAVIRTTFIVGFPGETNADFETLRSFVESMPLDRGGVFEYSREEGTKAYRQGRRPASNRVQERQEILEGAINENAERFNRSLVGRTLPMLLERVDKKNKTAIGRFYCDAPEIDFQVELSGEIVRPDRFQRVHVVDLNSTGFVTVPAGKGE